MTRTKFRLGARAILYISLLTLSPVHADDPVSQLSTLETDNGLLVHTSSDARLWLDGRIGLTAAGFDGSANDFKSGTELRRARLAIKSVFDTDWAAELDIDLTDQEVEIKDAWVAYTGWSNTVVTLGNQKLPVGLEQLETSKWITFIERALPDQLIFDRRVGAVVRRWGQSWQAAAGVFGEEPGDGAEAGEEEGWGAAGRFSGNMPLGGGFLHLGVSGSKFTTDGGDDRVRFRQRPEVHLTDRLLNTGRIRKVKATGLIGAESAIQFGSFSLQAEYLSSSVQRRQGLSDVNFTGWYAYGSWMFGGARRTYFRDSGEFGYPHHPGGGGVLELAARYSTLDLNDADVQGGEGSNLTLGVNGYPNRQVKIS